MPVLPSMRSALLPLSLLLGASMIAQNPTRIALVPWADNLPNVVDLAHCGDFRLFAVQQNGVIRIITDSMTVLPTPFLDIHDSVLYEGEQGLLGLAFDPDYAVNGCFYVNYVSATGGTHSRISRFRVSGDHNVADPASERILYTVQQPYVNHKGGDLDFGPDGLLYVGFGDGGDGGDPQNHAQTLSDPLGDMIRIDVSDPDTTYTIPPSNPFVNAGPDTLPEIWASGLRNPFRFGFDRLNGDLWIGDVGQSAWEEIDHRLPTDPAGANFGWHCYEGIAPYNTQDCQEQSAYVQPVIVHVNDGAQGQWCAIVGGRVYRGAQWPHLYGRYLYTDFCKGEYWSLRPTGADTWIDEPVLVDNPSGGACIAENAEGELFTANLISGTVFKLIDRCPMDPPTISLTGAVFTSTPADSYQWYFDNDLIDGATGQSYQPTLNGDYFVVADFGDGCVLRSDTLTLTNVGLSESTSVHLLLDPNPANEELTARWERSLAVRTLVIRDLQGRALRVMPTTTDRERIDTRGLATGSYLLELCTADGRALAVERFSVVH